MCMNTYPEVHKKWNFLKLCSIKRVVYLPGIMSPNSHIQPSHAKGTILFYGIWNTYYGLVYQCTYVIRKCWMLNSFNFKSTRMTRVLHITPAFSLKKLSNNSIYFFRQNFHDFKGTLVWKKTSKFLNCTLKSFVIIL